MHVLLDTHIYLWHVSNNRKLSDRAKALIVNAESVHISSATLWEIAIKVRLGKLSADLDRLIANLLPSGFHELPITSRYAAQVLKLPLHHTDPFDRMLISQAICESIYLITADRQLSLYSNLVIRV